MRAQNETLLLLNLLAHEVMHAGRCVMERPRAPAGVCAGCERVLRVASRVVRHRRRLTFIIAQDAAADWLRLCGVSLRRPLDWALG